MMSQSDRQTQYADIKTSKNSKYNTVSIQTPTIIENKSCDICDSQMSYLVIRSL